VIYLGSYNSPFLMDIVAYTSPGCFYCDQLKELFKRADLEYTVHVVSTPEDRESLKKKYPLCNSFPHVIIDGEVVGGLVETARLLVKKGLVSSTKK